LRCCGRRNLLFHGGTEPKEVCAGYLGHPFRKCDFLQVTDLLFRSLFAFFIIELKSWKVIHVGVTRFPPDAWAAQQLRVVAHLSRMARSRLERWRKRRRHASCMTTDLVKDNVMRTKRARRWRSVLFQRSTWAVSPVSFPCAGSLGYPFQNQEGNSLNTTYLISRWPRKRTSRTLMSALF